MRSGRTPVEKSREASDAGDANERWPSGSTLSIRVRCEPAALASVLTLAQVGLGAASVGLLAHAALTLTSKCAPDRLTKALATGSAAATVLFSGAPPAVLFPIVLIIGGIATSIDARNKPVATAAGLAVGRRARGDKAKLLSSPGAATYGRTVGLVLFAAWVVLFVLLFLGAGGAGGAAGCAGCCACLYGCCCVGLLTSAIFALKVAYLSHASMTVRRYDRFM